LKICIFQYLHLTSLGGQTAFMELGEIIEKRDFVDIGIISPDRKREREREIDTERTRAIRVIATISPI
jgi:hypothetical protein